MLSLTLQNTHTVTIYLSHMNVDIVARYNKTRLCNGYRVSLLTLDSRRNTNNCCNCNCNYGSFCRRARRLWLTAGASVGKTDWRVREGGDD